MPVHKCDKCDGAVPVWNDALEFAKFYSQEPETKEYDGDTPIFGYRQAHHRHLFPVDADNERARCEGSPSRAQYLGQQADTREQGDHFRENYAPGFRRAFDKYRQKYPRPEATI